MLIKTDIQTKISTVFKELEEQVNITSKEASIVLRIHHGKFRFHMDEGTMDSEDYLKSEEVWDSIDQKLKTLEHIKLILEPYRSNSGEIEDIGTLDKEFLNYINIATEKELHNIAEIFTDYRTRLAIENSDVDELIKLKIKSKTNSQFIKETFIKACQNLDASIFEPLIDEDQYFEELNKYRFLNSMKEQFDYLRAEGLKEVKLVMGKCEMCFKGERVHEFYVKPNIGKPAFSYNIQEKNGEIKDIFRCNLSSGYGRAAREDRDPDITYINYD